jgi:hypothetical protein
MRKTRTFIVAAVIGGMLALPALADAQGRAVPRGGGSASGGHPPGGGGGGGRPPGGGGGGRPPGGAVGAPGHAVPRPPGNYPNNGYGYGRPYYGHGYYGGYYGYPWYGAYYGYGYPYGLSFGFGFGYPGYGYGYYGYPAYGYPAYAQTYGGVRIAVAQRDAEVFVDGYYAGVVDQYDGTFQQVNLQPGTHRIEVRAPGFDPAVFDVNVLPGQTITYRAPLRPAQP